MRLLRNCTVGRVTLLHLGSVTQVGKKGGVDVGDKLIVAYLNICTSDVRLRVYAAATNRPGLNRIPIANLNHRYIEIRFQGLLELQKVKVN